MDINNYIEIEDKMAYVDGVLNGIIEVAGVKQLDIVNLPHLVSKVLLMIKEVRILLIHELGKDNQ